MSFPWRRARLLAAALAAVPLGLAATPATSTAAVTPVRQAPAAGKQAAVTSPETVLGGGWRGSSDVLVTGIGDSAGFHLYVAREKDAFAWRTLATLTASALDNGPWTGEVCVTGSGRYAVAVYAPAVATNKPKLLSAGALAAVVDVRTGKARTVATGVQLAYFNPACGAGDRALLTRAIGEDQQETDLLTVDAAAARVLATRRIHGQFTTPAPAPDGDYGIVHGRLVKVDAAGRTHRVGSPRGQVFAVHATAHHGLDVISVAGKDAVAERFQGGRPTTLGTGPWDRLQLFGLPGGRTALVGDVRKVGSAAPELSVLHSEAQVEAVSAQGHLLAERMLTRQAAQTVASPLAHPDARNAGSMQVTVRATRTDRALTGTVTTTSAPTLNALPAEAPATGKTLTATAASTISTPKCAIGRNDPYVQALQPSPDQVEWAVDLAVHNNLTLNRPADYLKTGQSSYTVQGPLLGMFRRDDVSGDGEVPAQVMLGILAQESNLSETSWHAVPGDLGNPLIADYYGNGNANIDKINYPGADCGYGISQVTDNMYAGASEFGRDKQVAVATDYAANIAAGLNILIEKWNQVRDDPAGRTWVNNGEANYIENWYLAVWSYNSGFHPSSEASKNHGHWGVGWLNNPANPAYPANRRRFLADYADAAHPGNWTYPEKVMGWAETPQKKGSGDAYSKPTFGAASSGRLSVPDEVNRRWFCGTVNNCNPNAQGSADPCPSESDACWWHGNVSFAAHGGCNIGDCATENLQYGAGSPEPSVKRIYARDCSVFNAEDDPYHDWNMPAQVVYDLTDTSRYALGCDTPASDGKFTLRVGGDWTTDDAYYGQVDLHQLGAGNLGHIWFTHAYAPSAAAKHHVTGTWTPELKIPIRTSHLYDIAVHLPSHGGEWADTRYRVFSGPYDNDGILTCKINQHTDRDNDDKWVHLGGFLLEPGARVALENIGDGANGTADVAYDAVAFIPTIDDKRHQCAEDF